MGAHLQDYDIKEGKAPRATNHKSRSSAKSRKKASPRLSLPFQTDALHQLLSIISVEQDIDERLSRQDDEGDLEASDDSDADDSDADDSDANDSDVDDQSATVDDAAGERLNEQTIDCSMLRNVLDEAVFLSSLRSVSYSISDTGMHDTAVTEPGEPLAYDLLFLVDATHSMHHFVAGINQALPDILRIAALTGSFERIGVMAYRDYSCKDLLVWSGWCCPSGRLSGNDIVAQSVVTQTASRITTQANTDTEEACKTGLAYAYQVMRPEATTIIVLYTDAPPHLEQQKDQNHTHEQVALREPSSYGGTGPFFADWTSAAKTLKHGSKRANVFGILKEGGVSVASPYQYLAEITGGLIIEVDRPTADAISRITTSWLLTWLGIDKSKIQTAEGRLLTVTISRYLNTKKIEKANKETEEGQRRFMVTKTSAIFSGNNSTVDICLNDLGDFMVARGPPLGNFTERYESDDTYKDLVVEQFRAIFRENVSAMALNPVFGSLWRAVCTGRGGVDRDLLAPIFSHHVNKIVNVGERERMQKWLELSYDYTESINAEIANVAAEDLYPLLFLDPTADFTTGPYDGDDDDEATHDDRPLNQFTRGELLEIGRSCDGKVLRRLGKVLTRLTIVKDLKDLPSHIGVAGGTLQVPYIPLSMTHPKYKRRFWKVLLHAVLPGTMLAARPAAVLAALSERMGISALSAAADAELVQFGPKWNDIDVPENWSPGCIKLILDADRSYEERAASGAVSRDADRPDACILRQVDRIIFRTLLDHKLFEPHLRSPFTARISWSPHKTQVPVGPVVVCRKCKFPRSVTVMAANNICGLCCVPAKECECGACTFTPDHADRECSNVTKLDDEAASAYWVECSKPDCCAQYVIYNPKSLSLAPKCFYCRHVGNPEMESIIGKAPAAECTQCLSRVIWPHEYRPAGDGNGGFEKSFRCSSCLAGHIKTVVEEETTAYDLKVDNGWGWLLRNEDRAIKHPFSGRSIHNTALNADRDNLATQVELLPYSNEVVTLRGKRIQNTTEIKSTFRERLRLREAAVGGTCALCFTSVKHSDLRLACGRTGCNQVICTRCAQSWYGINRAGRIINVAAMNCPFCRRLPAGKIAKRYNLAEVGDLSRAVAEAGEWIYAWCETCNFAKQYIERQCANGAPRPLRHWICEPCTPPPPDKPARKIRRLKVCPSCGVMTDRISGCLHISCPCGAHWCFGCGEPQHPELIYFHIEDVHGGMHWTWERGDGND